jgi:hypothetical protein
MLNSSKSMRHPPWYFILNWQNTFDFIPDYPHIRTDLKVDITNQALAIKSAALAALRQAYSRWPVVVVEGTPNTGDHQAVVQTTSAGQGDSCGTTNVSGAHPVDSEIWYECNMETAQEALHVTINNAQDESVALTRNDLIQSIGRGIGNNGAHEIAHQLLILCCSMEVLISADPNALEHTTMAMLTEIPIRRQLTATHHHIPDSGKTALRRFIGKIRLAQRSISA